MKTEFGQCQICSSGMLTHSSKQTIIEYKGKNINFELSYSICDQCGVEQTDDEQLRKNKHSCDEAKDRLDRSVAENKDRI